MKTKKLEKQDTEPFIKVKAVRVMSWLTAVDPSSSEKVCPFFLCVCVCFNTLRIKWTDRCRASTQHTSFVIRYAGFNYSSTKSSVNQTLLLVALCCLLSVFFCFVCWSQHIWTWAMTFEILNIRRKRKKNNTTFVFVLSIDSSFTPPLIPVSGIKEKEKKINYWYLAII